MSGVWKFLVSSTKLGVFGGAFYLTVQQGLWSSSNVDGAKALTEFREKVIPTTNDYIRNIPEADRVFQSMKAKWNSGIEWTANGIAQIPDRVVDASKKSSSYIKQTLRPSEK